MKKKKKRKCNKHRFRWSSSDYIRKILLQERQGEEETFELAEML
jgi:hypothetical protein